MNKGIHLDLDSSQVRSEISSVGKSLPTCVMQARTFRHTPRLVVSAALGFFVHLMLMPVLLLVLLLVLQ